MACGNGLLERIREGQQCRPETQRRKQDTGGWKDRA